VPRIQRFAHTVQRLAYVKLFKPEQRDVRPDDVLVPEAEKSSRYAAWSATSFSEFVPYRDPAAR
jgi:hypothetical protein